MAYIKIIKTIVCILFLYSNALQAQQQENPATLKTLGDLPKPDSSFMFSAVYIINEQPKILSTFRPSANTKMKLTAIASSHLGKGKILLIGSSAYFRKPMLNDQNVTKGIDSILSWARPLKKRAEPLIGVFDDDMEDFISLIKNKCNYYRIDKHKILKNTSVIFLTRDIKNPEILKNIEDYIRNGGNLVFGSPYGKLKWGGKESEVKQLNINTLFLKSGLSNKINPLFNGRLTEKNLTADTIPPYLHPLTLLPWLISNDPDRVDYYLTPYVIQPTIDLMFENNESNSHILGLVKKHFKYADSVLLPSKEKPLRISNNEQKWGYRFKGLLAEKIYLNNPTAKAENYKNFPGTIPADRVLRTKNELITIPVRVGSQGLPEPYPVYFRPHRTGFYIPAGERVLITLDESYITQSLKARIGVHRYDLSELDSINRDGHKLTRTFELNKKQTEVYSPYGGLLSICIADNSSLKEISFTLTGAVKAPRFDLHKTTKEQWKTSIRNYPAPWAELATDNVIFTVPSAHIRTMEDPEKILEFWDKVMNANADLAAISPKRIHPESIIVDSEIAFGYMFTTREEIVIPDDKSLQLMLDVDRLEKEGSWGHFHEIGHRHQFKDLDFSGLEEITVNLFTLFTYDQVLNKKLFNNEKYPDKQKFSENMRQYLNGTPSFKNWKNDPFLGLSMYIQIVDFFGWEAIKKVYRKYRALPKVAYPKSNQDKIDLWFTSICEATNSNLTDFFEIWQIPVSKTAKHEVKKYKTWIPKEIIKHQ
ncbi:M60 family metallopeptidase [Pedobacter caeni]|uniref:Peptidase M60, enhancin and enhancin-like n=1 Tax=Pedobacter caeni TaxID=288992 RepID=A0A1M5EEI8_9SPHI|nr:M60 family metallopeptidase [Pedobacter caeni]SHF77597.1 Peptidase M60, enhancin and enhancin-like [Pedobacter caeni]